MKPIGVDFGRGFTKAYDGKTFVQYPSVVGDPMATMYWQGSELDKLIIARDGRPFAVRVGKAAGRQSMLKTLDFSKERSRQDTIALVGEAFKELRVEGDCMLVVGAPLRYWRQATNLYSQWLKGKWEINGVSVTVKALRVLPEPVGTMAALDSSFRKQGTVAILDFGMYTTDGMVFYDGQYSDNQSFSFRLGIRQVLAQVAIWVLNEYSLDLDHLTLAAAIQSGMDIMHGDTVIPLTNKLKEAVSNVAQVLVLHEIDSQWEDLVNVDSLVVTGGGSYLMFPEVHKWRRNAWMVDSPERTNAIGFYRIAKELVTG